MSIGGEPGTELTPRVEHRLVERVAVRPELRGERAGVHAVDRERGEDRALALGELLLDGVPQGVDELTGLALPGGVDAEPVGEPLPRLGVELHPGRPPEVAAEL